MLYFITPVVFILKCKSAEGCGDAYYVIYKLNRYVYKQ